MKKKEEGDEVYPVDPPTEVIASTRMRCHSRRRTRKKRRDVKNLPDPGEDCKKLRFLDDILGSTKAEEQTNIVNVVVPDKKSPHLEPHCRTSFSAEKDQIRISSGKPWIMTLQDDDANMTSISLELILEDSSSNSAGYSHNTSVGEDTMDIAQSTDTTGSSLLREYHQILCEKVNLRSPEKSTSQPSNLKKRKIMLDSTVELMNKEDGEDDWTLQKWKLYHKQQSCCQKSKKNRSLKHNLVTGIEKNAKDLPCLITVDSNVSCSIDPVREGSKHKEPGYTSLCGTDQDGAKFNNGITHIEVSTIEKCHQTSSYYPEENSVNMLTNLSPINLELEDESDVDKSNCLSIRMQEDDACSWALKPCADGPSVSLSTLRPSEDSAHSFNSHIGSKKATINGKKKALNLEGYKSSKIVLPKDDGKCTLKYREISLAKIPDARIDHCHKNSSLNNALESFEIEEDYDFPSKPTKIPCKRKAISPFSQKMLLRASKLDEFDHDIENQGVKKRPYPSRVLMENNNHDENCLDLSGDMLSKSPEKIVNVAKKDQTLQESPCHNHRKPLFLKIKSPSNIAPLPSAKHLTELRSSQPFSNVQNLSLVSHNSSSSPLENIKKVVNASTVGSSPHIPVKGILKSTSNTCKDQCYCEKCASTRLRAKKASEFSQRQMQDIEGIAAMLMKDLSTLREIVEDKLMKRSAQPEDVHSSFSTDEVRIAAINALETEETAKKWLVRMSRDSNRYCKIMRMDERKLTFADEQGGKLCHIKVFNSQPT